MNFLVGLSTLIGFGGALLAAERRPNIVVNDLLADPDEVVNLAEAADQQEVKRELIEKLKAFQVATKDPWLHKWKYE